MEGQKQSIHSSEEETRAFNFRHCRYDMEIKPESKIDKLRNRRLPNV
jgi:hypothetical protein